MTTACIINIGFRERQRRMRFGVVLLVAGAVLTAILVGIDASRAWRIASLLPFWAGALAVMQAREKT